MILAIVQGYLTMANGKGNSDGSLSLVEKSAFSILLFGEPFLESQC